MIELDQIYLEDCLDGMKRIPDRSVDAIICDPPFGTTDCKWDSVIPVDSMWDAYKRIIKPTGAIVLFSQQPFASALIMSNPKMFKYEWIWEKEMGTGFLNAKIRPMKNHENVLVFSYGASCENVGGAIGKMQYHPQMRKGTPYVCKKGGATDVYHGNKLDIVTVSNGERYPVTIIKFDRDADTFHPTQKPVALIQYLVRTYTNRGDTVLDNCMGSGTTAIACIREHRHYIGFETCREYWEKSLKRIEDEKRQLTFDFGEI